MGDAVTGGLGFGSWRHSSASKPCSVVAQLAQFFSTDAQRFSVCHGQPRPAADDVAACARASAARSTSQLAGWPASRIERDAWLHTRVGAQHPAWRAAAHGFSAREGLGQAADVSLGRYGCVQTLLNGVFSTGCNVHLATFLFGTCSSQT